LWGSAPLYSSSWKLNLVWVIDSDNNHGVYRSGKFLSLDINPNTTTLHNFKLSIEQFHGGKILSSGGELFDCVNA